MKKKEINYQLLIRRICLIVLDIICIIAASILALLTRFEFDFSQIPKEFLKVIYKYGPFTIVITLIIFSLFRIYSSLWEYAGIEEVFSLIAACLAAAVAKIVIILFTWSVMPRSWYVLDTIYLMILIGATRVSYRLIRLRRQNRTFPWSKRKKVMIIGGGEAGRSLITEIQNSKYLDQKVVCIIDDDPYKIGRYIKGVKVVGNRNSIKKSVKKYNVQQIILTIPSANAAKIRPIVEICQDTNCELTILPGVYQLVNGEVKASKLRPVNIDDLLGRDEVHVNLNEVMDYVSGRVIMVTGGGGSIGSELCRQIAKHSPKQLIIFDIYENNAYDIQQELLREQPKLDLVVLIGSVRDENRINSIFEQYRPEIIYHAAAHKHVPLMEGSPNEAIKNNVLGTYNMVRMADKWNAKRFVQISTDKAVNPTNIMGASKSICEMIIQTYNKESNTEYVAVRFGNVLGSNGSVIPLFKKQIAEGGPVTVTHPEIIRYFMTIPEAVSLVLQAGAYAKGGEIFVLDMGEPVKILDLARNMIRLILGLIRPQEGEAVIVASNGREIVLNAETRHFFAYVPQGNTILSGTIAENMRMVKEDATDEEIIEALKIACAWEFVEKLPDTINSALGERGRGLSEGQAQRISIARAVLRNAPILLLDEATSALDVTTERKVLRNIIEQKPNKTCIVTTHRPSVLNMCQRVYRVMETKVTELDEEESSRMAMDF